MNGRRDRTEVDCRLMAGENRDAIREANEWPYAQRREKRRKKEMRQRKWERVWGAVKGIGR